MASTALLETLSGLGSNKIMIGVSLFILNVSAGNIFLELSPMQTRFLQNDVTKRIILFALFFVGTRDIVAAITLTLLFSIIVLGLFHEDARYNLVSFANGKEPASEIT